MIRLNNTTESLEIQTTSTSGIDIVGSFDDITVSGGIPTAQAPGAFHSKVTTATTTPIVAAPPASTTRIVHTMSICNVGTGTNTITVKKDVSGTEYLITIVPLLPGEVVHFTNDQWSILDNAGRLKVTDASSTGITGRATALYKIGTAPEAAGQWYSWAKDTGSPGAWAPGTPGLNGRATDGTLSADAGSILIGDATGANYLVSASLVASVACSMWLFDVMWVNSGVVVTTTTPQAITPVALPARDVNGSTDGLGVWAGILVTAATTNASAVTNTTITYTNSAGAANRTATIASFPATAVAGTVVWFQLAAGDTGVRSIQSVTLGTSYGAGAISVILARPLFSQAVLVANVGGASAPPTLPGVRLYNGTTMLPFGLMSATTATTLSGTVQIMDR
jgi:hypothetical protein